MRNGVHVQRRPLEWNVKRNRFEQAVGDRREYGQSLCRFWRLTRDVLRNAFSAAFKIGARVRGQRTRLLVETVAKECVDMHALPVLIRAHVEIKADDGALRWLDGGQTVQWLAKWSLERSRVFGSHTVRIRKGCAFQLGGRGKGEGGRGRGAPQPVLDGRAERVIGCDVADQERIDAKLVAG